jgi:hypothetical protein
MPRNDNPRSSENVPADRLLHRLGRHENSISSIRFQHRQPTESSKSKSFSPAKFAGIGTVKKEGITLEQDMGSR